MLDVLHINVQCLILIIHRLKMGNRAGLFYKDVQENLGQKGPNVVAIPTFCSK